MNTLIRKQETLPTLFGREIDPIRMMRDLLRWEPFQEFGALGPITTKPTGTTFFPPVEIKETKDSYLFRLDVPGVKESELDVTVTGNRLTVTGKREIESEEQNDTYYAFERSYGTFARNFTLPEGVAVDHLHAELQNGVLAIAVPKLPEVQPKKIAVKAIARNVRA